jgi:hypothetical protein
MSEHPSIEVEASPTFDRNLRTLAKKYRIFARIFSLSFNSLNKASYPETRFQESVMPSLSSEFAIVISKRV